jgi:hypothetical protein
LAGCLSLACDTPTTAIVLGLKRRWKSILPPLSYPIPLER